MEILDSPITEGYVYHFSLSGRQVVSYPVSEYF